MHTPCSNTHACTAYTHIHTHTHTHTYTHAHTHVHTHTCTHTHTHTHTHTLQLHAKTYFANYDIILTINCELSAGMDKMVSNYIFQSILRLVILTSKLTLSQFSSSFEVIFIAPITPDGICIH